MLLTEELLTPEEVAKLLKVDKRTIYHWIEKKAINYYRINRKVVRFRHIDIKEFLQKHLVKSSDVDVDEMAEKILSKLS